MRIHLLSVSRRVPDWVEAGYQDYARRLGGGLQLHVVAPVHRSRGIDTARAKAEEGARLLAAVPARSRVVALDVRGRAWSTAELAKRLEHWRAEAPEVALLVGGADGLAPACLERAEEQWSLSPLTLPHGLVRVLVAEQIYRAWSLIHNHPYHRQ